MRQPILFLILGILCAALLISAVSVYVFHDVDKDQIGHSNAAFAGLCAESLLFALIIGGPVALLTFLGRHLLHLKGHAPRAKLGLYLGIGVPILQYLWEFAARLKYPQAVDIFRSLYFVVAITLCTFVLLRDTFNQKKLHEASTPSPAN